MKKTITLFIIVIGLNYLNTNAQNYQISFAGTGASTTVDSVKVENLTQGIDTTISGSDILNLTITTGINELAVSSWQLAVYPNPMQGNCKIEFEAIEEGNATIELYDIAGKRILQLQEILTKGKHTYSLSGLNSGIFFLKVESNSYFYSAKIVSTANNRTQVTQIYKMNTDNYKNKVSTVLNKGKQKSLKGTGMPYTSGDQLKLTGYSGIYSTVVMLVPTHSQTVTFYFVACGDNLLDSRDGKSYTTVQIGTQCWMKENLNIGTFVQSIYTGTSNPHSDVSNNGVIEKYCYKNDVNNCNIYGGLYDWNEMMQYVTTEKTQGICPTAWHIPSDAEWQTMVDYLGGSGMAGGKMKSTGTKEAGTGLWYSPNMGATNESGFSSLPGGYRYIWGSFENQGYYGYYWSLSEFGFGNESAWYRFQDYHILGVGRSFDSKELGYSVRCIKDNCPAIDAPGSGTNMPSQEQIIWNWQGVTDAVGYKWNTTDNYSTATDNGTSTSYTQSGLECDSTYTLYVWAYNICGHSSVINLTENTTVCPNFCGGDIIDDRDDKNYKTVLIGIQCWMAENLNTGSKIDKANSQTDNMIIEKYCYNNDEANCDVYGGLYQWDEMMQYVITQSTPGICPAGWHLPNSGEWNALINYLGGDGIAGGKVKEEGTAHWISPNQGADNSSGFTALPGGMWNFDTGLFNFLGSVASFWSSTAYFDTEAWATTLNNNQTNMDNNTNNRKYAFSVRCIKDCPAIKAPGSGTNVPSQKQIIWNWKKAKNAAGYKWNTINDYNSATDNGLSTSYTQKGLKCDKTYTLYVWAYNTCGNYSGKALTEKTSACVFTCGDTLIDNRDSENYKTVKIGSQCWMKENLRATKYNNGTLIPIVTDSSAWANLTSPAYCWYYNDSAKYYSTFGALYNWVAVKTGKLCPAGWHVPSDAEWLTLENTLGGQAVAGGKMKTTGTLEAGTGLWESPNKGATNESGFSALPSAYRHYNDGTFCKPGITALIWSTTQDDTFSDSAMCILLNSTSEFATRMGYYKVNGQSVRCLKD